MVAVSDFRPMSRSIPVRNERNMAVRITKDALRHVRSGHPWIYGDSIVSTSHEGAAGDLAIVFDDDRRFAAVGLFDPGSPIAIKVLHQGKPVAIDASWWDAVVAAAGGVRRPLIDDPRTTGYRLINGENDGMPGIVVDRYDSTLVLKIYSQAWFPHLADVVDALVASTGSSNIAIRLSRKVAAAECFGLEDGEIVMGSVEEPTTFLEHGLQMLAHPLTGQKTGFFLDQRDNRRRVKGRSEGARVLDLFSCSGGFSVSAAAGGAVEVTSVDISADAIATARAIFEANHGNDKVAACAWNGVVGDAFEVMRRLRRDRSQFDVVIIDPPSFAQRQSNVAAGLKAYARLTEAALELVADGGLLVQASCSSRITADEFFAQIHRSARAAGVGLGDVARTQHGIDHPVTFPEGAYLKALFSHPTRRSPSSVGRSARGSS